MYVRTITSVGRNLHYSLCSPASLNPCFILIIMCTLCAFMFTVSSQAETAQSLDAPNRKSHVLGLESSDYHVRVDSSQPHPLISTGES